MPIARPLLKYDQPKSLQKQTNRQTDAEDSYCSLIEKPNNKTTAVPEM